ncbi:MAG: hypothetical protein AB1757_28070 [Acidobacteriota bacterium]
MVEILGLVLAVLAFVVGIWHLREIRQVISEARNQTSEAKSHTTALDEVRRSLSTRYIGQFPEYFPEVVAFLEHAKREIEIFCDYPAYGSFSDPINWLAYRQALERKIQQEEVRVNITCLNETSRNKSVIEQFFKPAQTWEEWKQDSGNAKRLEKYLSLHGGAPGFEDLTREYFLEMLKKDEKRTLEVVLAGAKIREIDSYVPLYFWIVDRNSAVFAIPSFSERAIEYGFSTTDQKLISAFEDMRDRYHRDIDSSTK